MSAVAQSQLHPVDTAPDDAGAAGMQAHGERDTSPRFTSLQLGLGWFPESPGGLDRFYYELVAALPGVGVASPGWIVGSSMAARETEGRIRALASATQPLPARLWAARAAVRESIGRHRPDLLVSHFALYAFPALASIGKLPLVVHFQGPWAEESRVEGAGRLACLGKKLLERSVYRRADRLICLSQAFGDILVQDYGVHRDRIRVVPAAVDVKRFDIAEDRREARQRLGWPTDRPIVLCVRRLVRRMGLENLVEAAVLLRAQIPDALILIAGRGPMTAALEGQIGAAGLHEHVKLLGFVPDCDLPRAYRAADLTVVPSVALEGFGLVAAESLAAGTPALVTAVGGLPDVVRGLGSQWVLPGYSPEQIARGLGSILSGRMAKLNASQCAAHVRANFSWPEIARRVRDVYEEVIGLRSHTDK